MANNSEILYFQILFVVDDKDLSKKYMNRMMSALKTVKPPLTIGREYILDTSNEKESIRVEKVIFLAQDPPGYIMESLQQWINKLQNRKGRPSKLMLINHGGQNQGMEIERVQMVNAEDLRNIHKFWPDVLKFLFNTKITTRSAFFQLIYGRLTNASNPCIIHKSLLSVQRCVDEFNIRESREGRNADVVVIALTDSFVASMKHQGLIGDEKIYYHFTHILANRKEAIKEDSDKRLSVHGNKDIMLCVMLVLSELKCISITNSNSKCATIVWWFVIVLGLLLNLPALLAYSCSPLTPLVLYIVESKGYKEMSFFYSSNIIFIITLFILLGLELGDILVYTNLRPLCITGIVYFLLIQALNYFYITKSKHYSLGSFNEFGLLSLSRYIWREITKYQCTKRNDYLKLEISLLVVFNIVYLLPMIPFVILLYLFSFLCIILPINFCFRLNSPVCLFVNFTHSILLAFIIWPLSVFDILSIDDACLTYISIQFYISGVLTLFDYFILEKIFHYQANWFNRVPSLMDD